MSKNKRAPLILTFNVGSSSVKYRLFEGDHEVLNGYAERTVTPKQRQQIITTVYRRLKKEEIIPDAIAHRVVHGGDIKSSQRINAAVIRKLRRIAELAPLHDIPEIEVIEFCKKHFVGIPQVAVFDTAFHQTMPEKAAIYGIPYKFYKEGIKRYGFHGISHQFVSRGIKGKVISCHIGSGASITAIKDGKSMDTSMGFTPLEGLVMTTRSGTIDPAIIPYLMKHKKMSIADIDRTLNKESGILGISGISNDLRDLLKSKNKRAKLAVDVFIYRIVKQIGAYVAALDGVDTIVFTAGVTERNAQVRKRIAQNLSYLGVKLDEQKNAANSGVISSSSSRVRVLVVPTNEELAMAQEARRLFKL